MAAVRHLGFSKVGNFNFRSHSEDQYASSYQISRRSVKPFWRYDLFSIFQDAAAAILDFGYFKFLTVGTLMRVELCLHAKFCRNRSNRGLDMAIFQFLKMAVVRHLGFSKVENFNFRSHSGGPMCVMVPNFAKIGQTVKEIWPIFDFQNGSRRHLGFWKF